MHGWVNIINFYNPCLQINISGLEEGYATANMDPSHLGG